MRAFLLTTAIAALLAACSPPAERSERPETPPAPATVACNDVAPDAARQVAVGEEMATAAAAAELRGGSIAPGTYDLTSASRIGAATGWNGTRAVALAVSDGVSDGDGDMDGEGDAVADGVCEAVGDGDGEGVGLGVVSVPEAT